MFEQILYYLVILLGPLSIVGAVLGNTALWQTKEYRWDRMREHLKLSSTQRKIFAPLELAKWLLLIVFFGGSNVFNLILWLIALVYVLDMLRLLKEVSSHQFMRPKFTIKALLVICTTFFLLVVFLARLMFSGLAWDLEYVLVADRATDFVVALVILFITPVSSLFKKRKIEKAINYRESRTDLIAVGITGSYGKSGTKEVLAKLLEGDNAAVTPGNTNTEMGVADFVLNKIAPSAKYLVAEMGAYRLGEIKMLARIVKPRIGILTSIGNQHLGLFGSHENIRRAKYELIESLPPNGTAIFNADDKNCLQLARETKHCRVVTYGINEVADLKARVIKDDENQIEAMFYGPVPETILTLPIVGRHQISNVLAGIAGALELGKTWTEIQENLKKIKMVKQTMEKYFTAQGALVIDDSYNANAEGVIAAIEMLGDFSRKKKIVILNPMIELGNDSESVHEKVGAALARDTTSVFYTGVDFKRELINGAHGVKKDFKIEVHAQGKDVLDELYPLLDKDTVVLLEGRVPKIIREALRTK